MKHNADELKKAGELYLNNYNSLPIEMRKALPFKTAKIGRKVWYKN